MLASQLEKEKEERLREQQENAALQANIDAMIAQIAVDKAKFEKAVAEREDLLQQERQAREEDARVLKEYESEVAAKKEELEMEIAAKMESASSSQEKDRRRLELEKELALLKESHQAHLEDLRKEKEERESDLQLKLERLEGQTKEQEVALEAERKELQELIKQEKAARSNESKERETLQANFDSMMTRVAAEKARCASQIHSTRTAPWSACVFENVLC